MASLHMAVVSSEIPLQQESREGHRPTQSQKQERALEMSYCECYYAVRFLKEEREKRMLRLYTKNGSGIIE